jgi:hypothetical protein
MYSNLLGQTVTSCRGEHFDLLPRRPMGAVQPNIIHVTPNSEKIRNTNEYHVCLIHQSKRRNDDR